jgi:hypothetical protein
MLALIARIEEYQKQLGANDSQFAAAHKNFVGSYDTWTRRLKTRDFKELNLTRWLPKLRGLVSRIDGQTYAMAIYAQLPMTAFAEMRFAQLQGATSDRRCVPLIGDYGTGKSWSLRNLQRNHPGDVCFVEFAETARESKGAIVRKLGRALGLGDDTNPDRSFEAILDALRAQSCILLIDEGHHGGLMLLKLVKSIINATNAAVMLGTYPTAWNRLTTQSSDAIAEARQFLGRCIKPIEMRWTKGSPDGDPAKYMRHAAGLDKSDAGALARKIGAGIRANGNLRLLADAVDRARADADEKDEAVSPEAIERAVCELVPGMLNIVQRGA